MQNTYLFYDIETTGLNKCFDQVLQFAAIRTDLELNELERYEIKIKPNCDVIPSPAAVITHYLSPAILQDGLAEIEAMIKIHQLLNTPGTISVGYNTLAFDDEFLRFSFARNLLTPYTHQYENRCKRMDIYPMLIFFYLYKPQVLPSWPIIDGKVSLKLENLSQANQLSHGRAHDAMVDVEATVALARYLKAEKPTWDYLCSYFDKATEEKSCSKLPFSSPQLPHPEGLMILGKFGSACAYQAPVLGLGTHLHYKNQTLWLRLDLPELRQSTVDNLSDMTWVNKKKCAEPGFLLPNISRFAEKISAERLVEVAENKKWLVENPMIFQEILDYHRNYKYPVHPNVDVDASLYQSNFPTPQEKMLCAQWVAAPPEKKGEMIERFTNTSHQETAIRILGRHYPTHLPKQYRENFLLYLKQVFSDNDEQLPIDFRGKKRMGIAQARQELLELPNQKQLNAEQVNLLSALSQYYDVLFNQPNWRFTIE